MSLAAACPAVQLRSAPVTAGGARRAAGRSARSRAAAAPLAMAASQPVPIMVNDLTGKMGLAVAEAVVLRGGSACTLVPVAFSGEAKPAVDVSGVAVEVQSIRDGAAAGAVLEELKHKYPGMIVVDYTLPAGRNPQLSSLRSRQVSRFVREATPGDRAHHSNMPPMKPAVDPGSRRR